MKEWFSAKELAGVGGLSKYPTNVTRQAKKEKWETRPMQGVKGGGFEYRIKSLPEEVQRAIRTKLLKLLPEPVSKGELDVKRENISLTQITDNQLSVASGRMAVVRWYLAQEKLQGLSRTKMLDSVVAAVKSGEIPAEICNAIVAGNGKAAGKVKLSKRTLYSWVLAFEAGESSAEQLRQMIPLKVEKRAIPERCSWLGAFLPFYQTFSNVAISQAYAQFAMQYEGDDLPSEHQVRYALKQLPDYVVQQGRKCGRYCHLFAEMTR